MVRHADSLGFQVPMPKGATKEMIELPSDADRTVYKRLAGDFFNFTWDCIENANRTQAEDDIMVNAAHASRFLWGLVGTPLNAARGEWQISRVYAIVGRSEPALHHATNSLRLSLDHQLAAFEVGFAYEALARAYGVMGDTRQRDENLLRATECAERVSAEDDKLWLLDNIRTVASLSLPKWGGH